MVGIVSIFQYSYNEESTILTINYQIYAKFTLLASVVFWPIKQIASKGIFDFEVVKTCKILSF